ncbi:lipase [Cryphonectria parasitica EP155]|uniref:Carboxylic ester hydrolase n=1 Tax=Cryphonectria parasitica (strain ATCC 38755 / EP155) TaxID=660469 RepID=A0A9P4Y2X3_CRYP1|nr:lipase [Cryphonectria parasitica EP155]KAF3765646.1 lipase [Cryphonectria parasitica EP155]
MKGSLLLTAVAVFAVQTLAHPAKSEPPREPSPVVEDRATSPTVVISPSNTVIGAVSGTVESYNGIYFADDPTGSLRLRPPQKLSTDLGDAFDASGTAAACPQMLVATASQDGLFLEIAGYLLDSPPFQTATDESENCLTVSVARPAGTVAGAGLPVLFWIFGGAFELGSTSMYDPSSLLSQAIDQDQPFVFVAVNYRVAGFGFMPGAEILADGASNLGLLDQRMALEWVADNIEAFGGDPTKVTIWGESAGSISVFDQMALYGGNITYNGQPLFRGAIMDSGSITPADPVDCPKGQTVYDTVVEAAGCASSNDTLDCLRALPYETFLNAANSVPGFLGYQSVALSYLPRPDGVVLIDSPDVLAANGQYAAVPMIIGDQEDEGTIFALFTDNVTTTADLVEYFTSIFFEDATAEQIEGLLDTYPDDIVSGSPFRTGLFNELYPQYKRIAAVLGDLVFTLTRRVFLASTTAVNPDVPSWSYLSSYDYGTVYLGTCHGSDLLQVFYGIYDNYAADEIRTYYYNFLYNLDPNEGYGDYPDWPQWADTGSGNQLAWFSADSSTYLTDDFRNDSYTYILANVDSFHI